MLVRNTGSHLIPADSSCVSPQKDKSTIHHRARSVHSAHRRAARKLACLKNQPVNVVTRNEAARGDRQDFSAARRSPRLNLSNLVSVQQHPVSPAPAPKRSDLSTRLDSQSRPYCLLYSHSDITCEFIFLLEGGRKYTKICERCQELFSKPVSTFFLTIAFLCSRIFERFSDVRRK